MTVHSVAPEDCCGCSACFNICPVQAITMQEDREGFKYPKIDERSCINCGKCEKACPVLHAETAGRTLHPAFYAVWNRQDEARVRRAPMLWCR